MAAQQVDSDSTQRTAYIEEIDFQKYWLVLKRRWLPAVAVFGATVGLALLGALSEDAIFQAEGKVLFKSDRTSSLTGLEEEDLGRIEIFSKEPLLTQAEIVRSIPVMTDVVEALELRTETGELVDPRALLARVKVVPVTGTDVLQVSVQSGDPEEATEIVNQVIESYRTQNIESNREEAAAARRFIEEQLPTIETEVLQVESELRQFKEDNDIIALDEEASSAVTVLSRLDQQLTQGQTDLADINARLDKLSRQLGVNVDEGIVLSTLNQSEGVQEALEDLQAVQAELANERSRYQTEHPTIAILERQQAESEALLRSRIQEVLGQELTVPRGRLDPGRLQLGELRQDLLADMARLEVDRVGLTDRMTELAGSRDNYLQRINNLPRLEKQQRDLERRLQAAQTTFETLLTQLQDIRVVENQTVGNVRVVSLAEVPRNAVGPNRKLYLAAGGFVGLLLAIAVAFLLDLLDSSVKTVREVKELFGHTLLGVIPLVKDPTRHGGDAADDATYPRLWVNQSTHAGVREAYNMLQANLKFLQSDTELKTVVVTSAVPGEGKSEVSANLAAALAQVGRRVLLVDADMRYPRQHHALKILNGTGLSHVITGQATAKSAIQTAMDNLDVLTAGVVPPNPVSLLDSRRMESLLRSFAQEYEVVIVDVPPIVGYADASILGKMADGILLVARPGVVDYARGRIANDTLAQSNQRVLGIVANGVNPANEPDGHFYQTRQEIPQQNESTLRSILPVGRGE